MMNHKSIEDLSCSLVETKKMAWGLKIMLYISIFFMLFGAWGLYNLFTVGVGVWGINNNAPWGWAIINFVFWIGLGHAGTLISAILLLFRQSWRYSFARIAEMMTLVCVICAAIFPAIHVGRVMLLWFLAPVPVNTGIWQQFKSPLMWDCFAITCYFSVSLIFFYIGTLPDFAVLRDKFFESGDVKKAKLFGILALGWNFSSSHWRTYKKTCYVLACLATPLVVSVHSIVSSDFAVCVLPRWNSPVYPAYFVAGAIFSGIASVFLVALPLRKFLKLENIIKESHISAMCKICLVTSLIVSAFYVSEWLEFSEKFNVLMLLIILFNCVLPQLFWIKFFRTNSLIVWILSLGICIGMWLERFHIVIIQFLRGHGVFGEGAFSPTIFDLACFIGSLGLFLFLITMGLRYVPLFSISEAKEDLR